MSKAVRERLEQTFGPGALEQTRLACMGITPRLKLALAYALDAVAACTLSDEYVLLGMLQVPEPRRPRFSSARKRNFWLVRPFSINGATDGPGADDSGGAGHKGWPPAAPSAGGPVHAAGASGARVTHDSDLLRTPEDPVPRFAQGCGHVGGEALPASGSVPRRTEGRIGEVAASSADK